MPFFADAQETAERYGKYITEFQELFKANDAGFGSPEDFFGLAPRLARDESFREGFTGLTKSVAKREEGRLGLRRMLTIIAIAMGGKEITQTGDEGAVPVSLMVVFLAGIGGWSETESAPGGVSAEDETSEETRETRDGRSGSVQAAMPSEGGESGVQTGTQTDEEREAKELEQRLTAGPEENLEALTTSLFGGPAQVKEALSRLEMNTLQMKMHLDSIDSRMERIEPHLDDLKSKMPAQPGAVERSEAVERLEPVPVPDMKPWPKESEEAPHPEWTASAPPMKEWPSEKEQDLVWEPKTGEKASSARAAWPAAEDAPEWRVPMRENEPEQESFRREAFTSDRRTLAQGASPLRTEPESRATFDDDPRIRVPFDRYLAQEEEPRRGRRMAGAFAGIVVMLAIVAGLLYSRRGWEGYHDAGQTAGAAIASGKTTVARWIAALRAPSSPGASQTPANPAGQPASGPPPQPVTASPSTEQPASSTTRQPPAASQTATPDTSAPGATPTPATETQRKVPASAAEHENQQAEASGPAHAGPESTPRAGRQGAISVLAGSGVAAESASALPPGMTTSVPVFVDEASLTPVSSPVPDYPHDALAKGVTGDVVVQAIVSRNGDVESAQIVSGPVGLLKSSVDAAREWKFKPYMEHGSPAEVRTYIRFRYKTQE